MADHGDGARTGRKHAHGQHGLELVLHELKTPLTSILLSAGTLLNGSRTPDRRQGRRTVERILQSARAMQCFVADLLDAAALDAGRLTLDPAPVDLDPLVEEAFDIVTPLALDRRVTLARNPGSLSLRAFCDRRRVLQVLLNVISNGVRFAPAGGVVTVRAAQAGAWLDLYVTDDGPGVPEPERAHLFQPWSNGADSHGGHGLGLFISHRIAVALGGSLTLEAPDGRGTTFRLRLPAHLDPGAGAPAHGPRAGSTP